MWMPTCGEDHPLTWVSGCLSLDPEGTCPTPAPKGLFFLPGRSSQGEGTGGRGWVAVHACHPGLEMSLVVSKDLRLGWVSCH